MRRFKKTARKKAKQFHTEGGGTINESKEDLHLKGAD